MLQPVASSEPVTSPPICAAVMSMPSRKKPVGVQMGAAADVIVPRPATRNVARTALDEIKPISLDMNSPSSQVDEPTTVNEHEVPRLKDSLSPPAKPRCMNLESDQSPEISS